jgi:acyl-CoA thioesterase FadM
MDWLGEALTLALTDASGASELIALRPRYYHIQYVHSARPGDRMRISTQMERAGSRRVGVAQTIRDDTTGQVIVECRSEHLARQSLPSSLPSSLPTRRSPSR